MFNLFGEGKFGEFQFGAGTLTRPRYALEIDWDNDGFFDGRNDALQMSSLKWERGKRYIISANGNGLEEDATGQLIGTLVDLENWYDPYTNADIGAGKKFRLWVRTPAGSVYDLMAGTLGAPAIVDGRGARRVQLTGEDGWGMLRDQKNRVSVALQQNIYADEAMNLLLDKIAWPRMWPRDLNSGVDIHRYWYADAISASQALYELAYSEMGRMWIAGDGGLTFRSRHAVDTSLFTITDDDVYLGSLTTLEPWDVVRNSIRVTATQREIQTGVTLWISLDAIRLAAGESFEKFVDFTYNGETVAGESLIAPVAGVDYVANTQVDASGVDITASISVDVDLFSTTGKLTITNNGSQAGYVLVPFTIRGSALVGQQTTSQAEDAASIRRYGTRSLDIDYPWVEKDNYAGYFARLLRRRLATPQKYLSFAMKANPEKQFAMDLGTQVDVNIVSKGISGTYRVYFLRGQWTDAAGISTMTEVTLEPVEATGDYWTVPHTIPMVVA